MELGEHLPSVCEGLNPGTTNKQPCVLEDLGFILPRKLETGMDELKKKYGGAAEV